MRIALAPLICLLLACPTSDPGGGGSAGGTQGNAGGTQATAGGTQSTAGGAQGTAGGSGTAGGTAGGATAAAGGMATAGGCVAPATSLPATSGGVQLLIVTRSSLEPSYQALAALHTVTGTQAAVVTIEQLCQQRTCNNSDPKNDTAKALKAELISRVGLKYVLLGGPQSEVPGRRVQDAYDDPLSPGSQYTADYPSDYYYADFSEWDTDGDGLYAEKVGDTPDLIPELAVTRLPLRSAAEVDTYVAKVRKHLTAFPASAVDKVALISNVAIQLDLGGLPLPIDSAAWFVSPGRTLAVLPQGAVVTKLYATTGVDAMAQPSTVATQRAALQAGPNLVVHSGHASSGVLMSEPNGTNQFTAADAFGLTNSSYPFFFSSGCEAAGSMQPWGAGERLMTAPNGGAIAYLGNVPVGLGIAGGMQLIDQTLKHLQTNPNATIGDAYLAGHKNLPRMDSFTVPGLSLSVPVVEQNSWKWTQKGAELLGDPAVPVWTVARPLAPTLDATLADACGQATLTVQLSAPFTGALRVLAGGKLYQVTLAAQSTATLELPARPPFADLGLAAPGTQYAARRVTF